MSERSTKPTKDEIDSNSRYYDLESRNMRSETSIFETLRVSSNEEEEVVSDELRSDLNEKCATNSVGKPATLPGSLANDNNIQTNRMEVIDDEESSTILSHSDSESDSDDEGESVKTRHLSEDGRSLSAYEIQRLERIRRNREYLSQLGLDDNSNKHHQSKSTQRSRKNASNLVPTRTIISRRSKMKSVRYTEPSESIRSIMHENTDTIAAVENVSSTSEMRHLNTEASENIPDVDPNSGTTADGIRAIELDEKQQLWNHTNGTPNGLESVSERQRYLAKRRKNERSQKERMALSLYKEMNRLKAHKHQVIKDVEKLVRMCRKEVRIWKLMWQTWRKQEEKQERQRMRDHKQWLETEMVRQRLETQQRQVDYETSLLGSTVSQLLKTIDNRMPEIVAAVNDYDECIQVSYTSL
jgi:hypothetical protein